MNRDAVLNEPHLFSEILFSRMQTIYPAVSQFALYEFRYGLNNYLPVRGWNSITLEETDVIEEHIQSGAFYEFIGIKTAAGKTIIMDPQIVRLCQMLFAGLVTGKYPAEWVENNFSFDLRGFFFLPRTCYFTLAIKERFGNQPYFQFEKRQAELANLFEIGYRQYQHANADIDQNLMQVIVKILKKRGTPILLTLAGPTAAGKTEIVERLTNFLQGKGYRCGTLEMDHFGKDRDYRDGHKHGVETVHFDLFINCIQELQRGNQVSIPQYNFYSSKSSHDENSQLRTGKNMLTVEPADVIFLEGNFPFQIPELQPYLGLKIVYLADDEVRLQRKWKRDIDLRKKYHPTAFINRYFRTQFIRAQEIYLPLLSICDLAVDTSLAQLWLEPFLQDELKDIND